MGAIAGWAALAALVGTLISLLQSSGSIGEAIVGTLVAAALGAANLGTALTFGQIAFAVALVWVLLKR